MRTMVTVVAGALLTVGCSWLPEKYAVNAPLANLIWGGGIAAATQSEIDDRLRVPDGLSVSLWASELPNARFLHVTQTGDLLVSQPRQGKVSLVARDANGDGHSDGTQVVIEGLNRPHGIDVHDGWLYVGESDAIGRIRFDPVTRKTSGAYERIVTGLPGGGNHWTRTVRVGPDEKLYVSIGSSCNVCIEDDARRAAIVRYDLDGSNEHIVATGLRNAVGFDWQPGTNALYATDNGRDLLGDDFPPCELNRVVDGAFYGWPVANGNRVPDPDFGKGQEARIASSVPPEHGFRAHVAPLGITFVNNEAAPVALRGAALVALHGSWNRTTKDGYEVVSLHWKPDGTIEERDFLTGFLRDEQVIGRPVDVAVGPDGAIYVSDDYAGAIYRVAPGAPASSRMARTPSAPVDPLAGLDAETRRAAADRGAALWDDLACATCHDPAQAVPGMVTKRLDGLGSRYTVASLTAFLAAPTPPMPAVDRPEDDRRALAVHLLSVHP